MPSILPSTKNGKKLGLVSRVRRSVPTDQVVLGGHTSVSQTKNGRGLDAIPIYLQARCKRVLVRDEVMAQTPIYYVSKALQDAETRYPEIEKLAVALIVAATKLRPYFQAHVILVPTSHPL